MSNSKSYWRKQQRWGTPPQTLTPLMEGPDPEMQEEGTKKEKSWEMIREWFRVHKGISGNLSSSSSSAQQLYNSNNNGGYHDGVAKGQDLRLLLGVLGCPLAPISVSDQESDESFLGSLQIKNVPFETSTAHYIIQQYLAATGCLKRAKAAKNMYATGIMKMSCCETEIAAGNSVKTLGGGGNNNNKNNNNNNNGESGCFVLWQMQPGMWSLELVLGATKLISGSDGKTVWRHTPWLGTHAAKGPQRPLRRLIQGLDPKTTAGLFAKAQCLGERKIGNDDCFVLKVSADRDSLLERNDAGAPAEVIRHALYGYFCQKSGLLIYLEDSHLTRVTTMSPEDEAVYWETTIGSSIGDYRDVDGVSVAHCGRAVATVFRFGETSLQYSRTRMEEIWRIDDVVFDVPGLSLDSFIPPADIYEDEDNNKNNTNKYTNVYSNVNSR